tara:strand:+ start:3626 stop:3793 length:168 start_codon:yes stop_codon:yes gene_type:complete
MKYLIHLFLISTLFVACTQKKKETVEVNIKGEEISYTADDLTMNGYIAYDASSKE